MKTENTQELEQRRNQMIFALENAPDALDSIVYKLAIDGIDKELRKRLWKRNLVIGLVVGALILTAILTLPSCETVKGSGRDIEWIGGAGQKFLEYRQE